MSEVYVVTCPEQGWDCVIGVFKCDDVSQESLEKVFPQTEYVIHYPRMVHKDTYNFEQPDDLENDNEQ